MKWKHVSIKVPQTVVLALAFAVTQVGLIAQTVNIPDPNLESTLREVFEKPDGAITLADMESLTEFFNTDPDIQDLTGMEKATNLTYLYLTSNKISDLSPLAELVNLTELHLSWNEISDMSPLAGLTNLVQLHISDNQISDISAMASMTKLQVFSLDGNRISDISSLAGLTNLRNRFVGDTLNLEENFIDITPGSPARQIIDILNAKAGLTISFEPQRPALTGEFPDPNLETAIRYALQKSSGTITVSDMESLTELPAAGNGISNLDGLERATNLTVLFLDFNRISDLSPLIGLTNLSVLDIAGNQISDLSPLVGLINLTDLDADGNTISDLSPLSRLTNLTALELDGNDISDLSPLTELINLTALYLGGNQISDLSPLAELANLNRLDLWRNQISDISPLVGLTNLKDSHIYRNWQSGPALNLDYNYIDITPGSPARQIIDELNAKVGLTISFESQKVGPPPLDEESVYIPDATLETAIRGQLRKPRGEITVADMASMTGLFADFSPISDLTGLEYATNLTGLDLTGDEITDISPLTNLTYLVYLDLGINQIEDISPLAKLTKLENLQIHDNQISDISPLTGLTKLSFLELGNNQIIDLSPLTGLVNLTYLHLSGNQISDLGPLAGLTNLRDWCGWGCRAGLVISHNCLDVTPGSPARQVIDEMNAIEGLTVVFEPQKDNETVDIPDPNLEEVLRVALDKPNGDITVADMESLTELMPYGGDIQNLTGLERAINLNVLELDLTNSEFKDLGPLAGLTNLTVLTLHGYTIADLSPLVGLTNLTELTMRYDLISDLSPLVGLHNLTELSLEGISDVRPLAGFTNLTKLNLRSDRIENLSPLAGLNDLTELNLSGDSISDITPLSELTNLTKLSLIGSAISDLSPLTGLINLIELELGGDAISDLSPLAGLNDLTELVFKSDSISDITPLSEFTKLTMLSLFGSAISDLSPLAGLTNLTRLEMEGISDLSSLVGMPNLTELSFGGGGIEVTDLSPLAGLTSLTQLELEGISDLSSLSGLTNLTRLILSSDKITDLSPVAGLTNLTELTLRHFWGKGKVNDLSPLAGLTNLARLTVADNEVSDLSPLAGLTKLTRLTLSRNVVSDLSPLAGATSLTELLLAENEISDLRPLAGLTNLTWIGLYGNNVSDLSPLTSLTNLRGLDLEGNAIIDLAPLANLHSLTYLQLSSNKISDPSPLAGLTKLVDNPTSGYWEGWRGPHHLEYGLELSDNYIDIAPGSPARQVIDELNAIAGLTVDFAFQRRAPPIPQMPPDAPSDLNIQSRPDGTVSVSWTDNSADELGFRILRKDESAGDWFKIGEVVADVNLFVDATALSGHSYTYWVAAFNKGGAFKPAESSFRVPFTGRLVNTSTRGLVETGDHVMIGSFIIQGDGPKKVLIRGMGASLASAMDVPILNDPEVTVVSLANPTMPIAYNDDWRDSDEAAIVATGIPPQFDSEAALITQLQPGAYSAILSGVNESTGFGLIEVYEADYENNARIINLSTRCMVQTGDKCMIGGFVVNGNWPMKVYIRALGPSLPASIPNKLADPVLELFAGQTRIAVNDNWMDGNSVDEINATEIPNDNPNEAAMIVTLEPGIYTAIVSGANGSSGYSQLEIYYYPD